MSRKFIVVATLVLAGFVSSSAPAAHAATFIKDGLPTGVFQREPAEPVDVECVAKRATADAKMARTIARCDRVARRTADTFVQSACRNKAVKKNLRATAALTCGVVVGGGKGGSGGVVYQYTCSGLMCSCVGDADCNDMFTNANCGDVTSCNTSGPEPACWCLKAL